MYIDNYNKNKMSRNKIRTHKEIKETAKLEYNRLLQIKKKVPESIIDMIYGNHYLDIVMNSKNEPNFHVGHNMIDSKENKTK